MYCIVSNIQFQPHLGGASKVSVHFAVLQQKLESKLYSINFQCSDGDLVGVFIYPSFLWLCWIFLSLFVDIWVSILEFYHHCLLRMRYYSVPLLISIPNRLSAAVNILMTPLLYICDSLWLKNCFSSRICASIS
jgi:hypothetical protein